MGQLAGVAASRRLAIPKVCMKFDPVPGLSDDRYGMS